MAATPDTGKKSLSDDIYRRLGDWFEAQEDEKPPELPDLELHDPELGWQIWMQLEATNWAWPPDVLLRQGEALMDDLVTIATAAGRVRKLRKK